MATVTVNLNNIESQINSIKKNHKYIEESTLRVATTEWTYSGTTVTVGVGGDYATLGAAISAISDGDIIQMLDGVYLQTDEPSGYFLINDFSKSFKVVGNTNDREAVILRATTATSFLMRIRLANNVTFENITIEATVPMVSLTSNMSIVAGQPISYLFKNCVIRNTSSSATAHNLISFDGNPLGDGLFQFEDCLIQSNENASSSLFIVIDLTNLESTTYNLLKLFNRCRLIGRCSPATNIKIRVYDSHWYYNLDRVIVQFGTDTTAPIFTEYDVDIRGCYIERGTLSNQHTVLLGRGCNKVVFENNNIYSAPSDNSLDIGVVLKSIAATLNDVKIQGNLVVAPRPIYLKGSQKCVVTNNTSVSVFDNSITASGFGIELNSPDEEVDLFVTNNIIEKNNVIGVSSAVGVSSSTTQTTTEIMNQNTFKDNQYSSKVDLYTNSPSSTFSNRFTSVGIVDVNSTFYLID